MDSMLSVVCSWYFGRMDREESSCILQRERDNGVFLVRESMSINGDYVLCVKLVAVNSLYRSLCCGLIMWHCIFFTKLDI